VDASKILQTGANMGCERFRLSESRRNQDIRKAAQAPTKDSETAVFRTALISELQPWAQGSGKMINAHPVILPGDSPWEVIRISTAPPSEEFTTNRDWPEILRVADQLAATEVIHPDAAAGCIWVAGLKQARYWSDSQARLVARRIAWEHMDFLMALMSR
jgi:hypothetical protein